MTTQTRDDEGATVRVVRALVPVALIVAVLGLMIVLGTRTNRQRVDTGQDWFAAAGKMMHARCNTAATALAGRQLADGSWPGGPAGTLRILLDLKSAGLEDHVSFAAGVHYVRLLERPSGLWPRVKQRRGASPPSLEVTALAWLLLGDELQPTDAVRDFFNARRTPLGLYRSDAAEAGTRLGDNLLLLGVVSRLGIDSATLDEAIRRRLDDAREPTGEAWPSPGYLASLAAEAGSSGARELLDRFVKDPRSTDAAEEWKELDVVSLADYLALRFDQCLRSGDPCRNADGVVAVLLAHGRPDGSWLAVASADGEVGAAEVTSLALRALTAYGRVLEGRSKGLLRERPVQVDARDLRPGVDR